MDDGWWYDAEQTYECAFCGKIIEHVAYDPCLVDVDARPAEAGEHRNAGWFFWAHASCVRDALHPELRETVADDYDYEKDPGRRR